jgi:peroxiredoxin
MDLQGQPMKLPSGPIWKPRLRQAMFVGLTMIAVFNLTSPTFPALNESGSGSLMSRCLASLALAAPARAGQPRFLLEPGLELRYTVKMGIWFDGKDGKPRIPREADGSPKFQKSDLTIYVLGRQLDGSFRVLMQRMSTAESPVITWADLSPDGRLTPIPSATPILEFDTLRTIFPLLPKDEGEAHAGWAEVEPRTEVRIRFSEADGTIKAECDGPLDHVSRGRWSILYTLDAQTHRPAKIVTDGRWDRYKETHSTIVTAKETVRHEKEWVAKFTADAEKYFEVLKAANRERALRYNLLEVAIAERSKPGAAEKMIDAWRGSLTTTRNAVTNPLFRADLDRLANECDEARKPRIEKAQHWAKFAGLPEPEWKATDLSGKEHSLAQLRGQVVVLDFWFRQCSFCMRAMSQIEQVEATFRQEKAPVSFFGVSIDDDKSDARFVADTFKLRYPVLPSQKLAKQLGVTLYPTLLVVAPDGTVQGIYLGYSLTLREDLTSCIRRLLKK